MSYCKDCSTCAHRDIPHKNSLWNTIPGIEGMTCFEILHSETCQGLWSGGDSKDLRRNSVATGHPVYKLLREAGLKNN